MSRHCDFFMFSFTTFPTHLLAVRTLVLLALAHYAVSHAVTKCDFRTGNRSPRNYAIFMLPRHHFLFLQLLQRFITDLAVGVQIEP